MKHLKSLLVILFGNLLFAITVKVFLMPVDLVTGGATGIALAIGSVTSLPVSYAAFVLNTFFWLLGLFLLGKKFAATTLISSAAFPCFLAMLEKLLPNTILTDDIVLCTVFAGLGIGISLGLVFREGSSTGGTDVIPLALNKYFKLPVSGSMYVCDILVLAAQVFVFPSRNLLYGIISMVIYSIVLDKMLLRGTSKTELKIVSKKYETISRQILEKADRGVTLLHGEGGYLHEPTCLILSIISNRQLALIEKIVRSEDPHALMIISRVTEVSGRGFTVDKEYR